MTCHYYNFNVCNVLDRGIGTRGWTYHIRTLTLLCKLWLSTAAESPYCANSGSKFENIMEDFWLHFYRREGHGAMLPKLFPVIGLSIGLRHSVIVSLLPSICSLPVSSSSCRVSVCLLGAKNPMSPQTLINIICIVVTFYDKTSLDAVGLSSCQDIRPVFGPAYLSHFFLFHLSSSVPLFSSPPHPLPPLFCWPSECCL